MMIKIKTTTEIERDELYIRLSEGFGWHTTLIPLFEEGKVITEYFPKEPGIFTLIIRYKELIYSEILLYKFSPKLEQLDFSFYKEGKRIFCKIKSECAVELNKEVVLNPISEDLQSMLDAIDSEGKE